MMNSLTRLTIGASLAMFAFSAYPATKCKDLPQGDCDANQACIWVPNRADQTDKEASARCKNKGCKGLDQAACTGSEVCTWIEARTRKDGKEVAASCRAKAAMKKKEQSAANKGVGVAQPTQPTVTSQPETAAMPAMRATTPTTPPVPDKVPAVQNPQGQGASKQ